MRWRFLPYLSCGIVACLISFPTGSYPQERDLPEEVRALAVVCSSGASVQARGDIEAGINRFFGKALEVEGEYDVSKSETEFLATFEEEQLRLEARKIYNDCVLGALRMVYNLKEEQALGKAETPILVPQNLSTIPLNKKFAMRAGDTFQLSGGGILSLNRSYAADCKYAYFTFARDGNRFLFQLTHLKSDRLDKRGCYIFRYGHRQYNDANKTCVFSLEYKCE